MYMWSLAETENICQLAETEYVCQPAETEYTVCMPAQKAAVRWESQLRYYECTSTNTSFFMQDKYMRSLAETENVRQRMKKQVDDGKLYGIQGFCKDLLEVADVLGTATGMFDLILIVNVLVE